MIPRRRALFYSYILGALLAYATVVLIPGYMLLMCLVTVASGGALGLLINESNTTTSSSNEGKGDKH